METKSANLHFRSFIHVINWCSFITCMGYILSLTGAIDIILFWWGFLSSWVCSAVNSGYSHLVRQIFDVEIAGVINFVELYFFHLFHHNSAPTLLKQLSEHQLIPRAFSVTFFFSILATACNYWCQFSGYCKHLTNLVIANWLWRISLGIWANQKLRNILNKHIYYTCYVFSY